VQEKLLAVINNANQKEALANNKSLHIRPILGAECENVTEITSLRHYTLTQWHRISQFFWSP